MRVPSHYPEFQCNGPDCEDICCSVWNITIDRDLYHRYKSNRLPALAPMFERHIVRNANASAPRANDFGTIARRADGSCSFLGEDRLCAIHKALGEDWLPPVCATYPRAVTEVDAVREASISICCPQAARILLLPREAMTFRELPDDARLLRMPHRAISLAGSPMASYANALRALCVAILQCRQYPIDARLILLGEFLSAAEMLTKNGATDQLPALMASIEAYLGDGQDYTPTFLGYPVNVDFKLGVLAASLIHAIKGQCPPRFRELVARSIDGLGLANDAAQADASDPAARYRAAYADHGRRLLAHNAHILENYLVSHAFMSAFPFGAGVGDRMLDHYRGLVVNYCLIKFVLVGVAREASADDEATMISVIQSFSRWASHAPGELYALHQMYGARGWDTFSAMTMLLRESD